MSNIWILVMSRLRSSVSFTWQKLERWTLQTKFPTKLFHTCHAYRHHLLLPFYTAITVLDLG